MDMSNRFRCIAMLTALSAALLLAPARAQVAPSAYDMAHSLWIGAEYSNVSASFPYQSGQRIWGIGEFTDVNLSPHIGFEGDARFLRFGGYQQMTESSYLAGPRAFLMVKGRFRPYGKMLVGIGRAHYPYAIGDGGYFALAPGAGTEYRVSRLWMVRLEYEYQMWLNSPGYANVPNHELTPNGFHLGVAYRVFR